MSGIWGRLRWSNSQCTKTPLAGTRGAVRNSGASEGRDTKARQFELEGAPLFRPLPLRERFRRAPLHLALPRAVEKADQPINHFLRFDLFHEVALYLRLRRSVLSSRTSSFVHGAP
jgi:hypothetical protein